MPPLQSAALAYCDYDPATERLTVTFHSGKTYSHEGVPEEVYQGLLTAGSPGGYYASRIKGVYG